MPPDKGARNKKKKNARLFITRYPGVSADLSCADVTEGGELQQEVVVREGHLGVGHAAVVTCGSEKHVRRALTGGDKRSGRRRHVHSHELWSRKSPEPSQFRKSPVSARTNTRVQPFFFCQGCVAVVVDFFVFFRLLLFYVTVKAVRVWLGRDKRAQSETLARTMRPMQISPAVAGIICSRRRCAAEIKR